VLIFPVVGALAYIILEVLPDLGRSKTVHDIHRTIQNKIDPHREVRLHTEALEVADTMENTLNLANTLRDKGMLNETLELS
jgi:Uncharacterized protein conserved in bacteria containing a divergent form of TPR repeats